MRPAHKYVYAFNGRQKRRNAGSGPSNDEINHFSFDLPQFEPEVPRILLSKNSELYPPISGTSLHHITYCHTTPP